MLTKAYHMGIISLLILYIITTFTSPLLADLISPVFLFATSAQVLIRAARSIKYKYAWYSIAAMMISFGLAEYIWFTQTYTLSSLNQVFEVTSWLFLFPNVFMVAATLVYFFLNLKKWHSVQLILDSLMTITVVLGVASGVVFSKVSQTADLYGELQSFAFYLATDLLTFNILLVMLFSSKKGKYSPSIKWVISGFVAYITADILFVVLNFTSINTSIAYTDLLFMVGFFFLYLSARAIGEEDYPDLFTRYESNDNIGYNRFTVLLVVIPVLVFGFGYMSWPHLVSVLGVVLVHWLLSHYLNKTFVIEKLLLSEQEHKLTLESQVAERTADLVALNKRLAHQSTHDALTGLNNRVGFFNALNALIDTDDSEFSLIYMDLDRFKIVNDLHGHDTGDLVLVEVANRLRQHLAAHCTVARLGGDEFAVIVNTLDSGRVLQIIDDIRHMFDHDFVVSDYQFNLDVSIGIARYPLDAKKPKNLLKFADIAMYHAKVSAQNERVAFYSAEYIERIERRNHIEVLLRTADVTQDFELYYQPQFNAKSRKLIGMEALIRWNHKKEGFISPGEFIPIAEETGLIGDISHWVMIEAMNQIKKWNTHYQKDLVVGINISPFVLNRKNFFKTLISAIRQCEVKFEWIDLEITEHNAMHYTALMEEMFMGFSSLGINISIDDFGTGYSSLSYIKRFDVDTLKIAKELIDNIALDSDDYYIVNAIVRMAEGMGLKTIAEGVETEDQLALLSDLGCQSIQGYVLGKPAPADVFEALYLKQNTNN